MKFLFLTISSFSDFPAYKRAVGTGEALANMGHSVFIAVMDCEENRCRMEQEAPHCTPLWFATGNMFREIWVKINMIKYVKPDVVYSTSYSVRNLAFLRFMTSLKICWITEFCELYSRVPRTRLSWKLRELWASFESSRILCASKYLELHFQHQLTILHINRPILYSPYAYPNYLCRGGTSVNKEENKLIVFMATLWKKYGVYDVIAACRQLMSLRSDFRLSILGGGPELDKVREYVINEDLTSQIQVHGFVTEDQLDKYFSAASVFVAPLHDTLQDRSRCPSKIFYYIPYEKPIVTCRVGEPEFILGNYAFYYTCDDVFDMARAINAALDKSRGFSYPNGFISAHSWCARAKQLEDWLS